MLLCSERTGRAGGVPMSLAAGSVIRQRGRKGAGMAVLRTLLGEALRTTRLRQQRTLREVSALAQVSLGYLSEVERGQKEASSELLASICRALGVRLSDVLRDVSDTLAVLEPEPLPVPNTLPVRLPALEPVGSD